MRWVVILCLIVGVGAGASPQQVTDVRAELQAKSAFERGRAAHDAGKTDQAVSAFERAVALDPTGGPQEDPAETRQTLRKGVSTQVIDPVEPACLDTIRSNLSVWRGHKSPAARARSMSRSRFCVAALGLH